MRDLFMDLRNWMRRQRRRFQEIGFHWNDSAGHEGVTFTGISISGFSRTKFYGLTILERDQ